MTGKRRACPNRISISSESLVTPFANLVVGVVAACLMPDANQIEVRFYPYAGLHHTIRVRAGRVYVRLSDLFRTAPPEVIRALAFLLVARLLSRKAPRTEEQIYRSYALSPQLLRASDLARRQRGRKVVSSSRGQVYDLK